MMMEIWSGYFGSTSKTNAVATFELWRKASHTSLLKLTTTPAAPVRIGSLAGGLMANGENIYIEHTDIEFGIVGDGEAGMHARDENGHGWLIAMRKGEAPCFYPFNKSHRLD